MAKLSYSQWWIRLDSMVRSQKASHDEELLEESSQVTLSDWSDQTCKGIHIRLAWKARVRAWTRKVRAWTRKVRAWTPNPFLFYKVLFTECAFGEYVSLELVSCRLRHRLFFPCYLVSKAPVYVSYAYIVGTFVHGQETECERFYFYLS
jgi:hypothetical protein